MNDIEKAIEDLKDIKTILKTQHMCKVLDDELTKKDVEDYKSRFASVNLAISALEKQLNGGWVPVDERLPEEYGCYLVAWRPTDLTAEDIIKNTGTVPHYYEMVEYDPDDEALWIGGIEQCESYEILAWQPLPEPYKEVKHVLSS